MRVLFLGTGDIALPTFEWLLGRRGIEGESLVDGLEVVGLVTQPDRPVGRKQLLTPPKIKEMALVADLPVFQPEDLREKEIWEELPVADLYVVMAYGQILKKAFIERPLVACINLHASLLPRWRGASCIQAAIREGDEKTGMTVMHVVRKLDAGKVIVKDEVVIGSGETGGKLHDRLAELAPRTLEKALQELKGDKEVGVEQDEELVTYAAKLGREDGVIDWSVPVESIERLVRAYDPWPGTTTTFLDNRGRKRTLKVFPTVEVIEQSSVEEKGEPGAVLEGEQEGLLVACGEGVLRILELQPDGSRRMSARDFLAGVGAGVEVLGI